ncbi:MAG: helix-turn-helix domain-containing protein [Gammaproteobacteria bacterium]|nr:helix-turn-helix domain-containing protein [Gammaproteobacteria bacterium]
MDKSKILTVIANNVRSLMNQTGLTSTELARRCKISTGTISKIINGNMSITIPMALNLAEGFGADVSEILNGLTDKDLKKSAKPKPQADDQLTIGVMSINNKRFTCVKNSSGKIIGTSELNTGLDLAEATGGLIQLIQESIFEALPGVSEDQNVLKQAKLNLVMQSFEFEDTRHKFEHFARKYFKEVMVIPDWQITHLATFKDGEGISLVTDKGTSLSFKHNGTLRKLGGWKYPVYDFGGENWLGVETIHHTIEAVEGYVPMSRLAQNVMSKFNGKIEKITETCFKGSHHDVYMLFTEILLRSYFTGDPAAKEIIESGFKAIYRSIERADNISGKQLKIAINGSLADLYRKYFDESRLVPHSSENEKVELLTDISKEYLAKHGVNNT